MSSARAMGAVRRWLLGRVDPRRRSQRGYTLIEVLLVVALVSMVMVPLTAWVVLAMRQQPITRDGLVRTADAGLLGAYLPEDVAVAGAAATDGTTEVNVEDCVAGGGVGGRIVLVLVSGTPSIKTVYSEAPVSQGGDTMGVWRRRCDASTGEPTKSVLVFKGVEAGSTVATCTTEPDDTPCRQVEFRTTPLTGGRDVVLRGTRRVDYDPAPTDATGNRLPVAKIQITSQTSGTPFRVVLTSAGSEDPDGTIASYEWTLSSGGVPAGGTTGPTLTADFSGTGEHYVQLRVTDDRGASATTYKRITAEARLPVAVARALPRSGVGGVTLRFSGSDSYDPDGAIVGYRWEIQGPGINHVDGRANFELPTAVGAVGMVTAMLTVTDSQGLSASAVDSVVLLDPAVTTTSTTTTTVAPGTPTASFVLLQTPGTGQFSFDASGSTSPSPITTYHWNFGLLAGTGNGVNVSHNYNGPGGYRVTLTVTNEAGQSASESRDIQVPGVPTAPNPSQQGTNLVWPGIAGVPRYQVEVQYNNGACGGANTTIDATASPSFPLPPSTCPGSPGSARVASLANGNTVWSDWVQVNR